jgi:addiction module HigA family antidote
LADIMTESGITANALALRLRVPANRIATIVQGKGPITAETALRLGRYFGTSRDFWMNLQTKYDLDTARDAA